MSDQRPRTITSSTSTVSSPTLIYPNPHFRVAQAAFSRLNFLLSRQRDTIPPEYRDTLQQALDQIATGLNGMAHNIDALNEAVYQRDRRLHRLTNRIIILIIRFIIEPLSNIKILIT